MAICRAIRTDGQPCQARALSGSDFCIWHNPDKREETKKKCLHVTIFDQTPIIEGTDDESYIYLRIPLSMAETGLQAVPRRKLGTIDPYRIVQMVEDGAEGELIKIVGATRSITIRVE